MTTDLRSVLRESLATSMRMRDRDATNVLRSTLAAIDNAEAVPAPGSANTAASAASVGVGSTETDRRELTSRDVLTIVRGEIDELSTAAGLLEAAQPDGAARLRRQAEVLTVVLAKAGH